MEQVKAEPVAWECFCDRSYYDMWCVRQVGQRTFGEGFHLVSGGEAQALCDMLNATPQPAAVDDRLLAALQIIANPDWSWMTAADTREHATEALAQIERKPEDV